MQFRITERSILFDHGKHDVAVIGEYDVAEEDIPPVMLALKIDRDPRVSEGDVITGGNASNNGNEAGVDMAAQILHRREEELAAGVYDLHDIIREQRPQ